MAMKPCERVGLDFIDSAPFRFVSTVDLAITKVTWTSPHPLVGAVHAHGFSVQ
jgi:hypothetical protein